VLRAEEQELPLTWSGGYIEANAATLTSLDAFAARAALPAAALADFRAFGARQGLVVPPDDDAALQRLLVLTVAQARWGTEGALRVEAAHDDAVREAIRGFSRAAALLSATP
jgi:hypothetical protein